MDQIQIGKFIASERRAHSLTQQQLADMLSISNKTVSKWECGKGLPDVSMLRPLCRALGLDINELLAGEHLDACARQKQAEETVLRLLAEQKAQKRSKMHLLYGAVVVSALSMSVMIALISVYTEVIPVPVKVFLTLRLYHGAFDPADAVSGAPGPAIQMYEMRHGFCSEASAAAAVTEKAQQPLAEMPVLRQSRSL